jgi:bifunctional DNase/RNase
LILSKGGKTVNKNAMKGIDFFITGVVRTNNNAYVILVDESASLYFPIKSGDSHAMLVENILEDDLEFNVDNYGLYFSFLSMFKAHEMNPTQIFFEIGKKGNIFCSMDVVEENELGIKVSRIPINTSDAVVLCAVCKIPIVVYGPAGTEFAFKIGKEIPKQNVFSFICDEIIRSERLSAIGMKEQSVD